MLQKNHSGKEKPINVANFQFWYRKFFHRNCHSHPNFSNHQSEAIRSHQHGGKTLHQQKDMTHWMFRWCLLSFSKVFLFLKNVYFILFFFLRERERERERERMSGEGAERERERKNPNPCWRRAQTHKLWGHDLSQNQGHRGTPQSAFKLRYVHYFFRHNATAHLIDHNIMWT